MGNEEHLYWWKEDQEPTPEPSPRDKLRRKLREYRDAKKEVQPTLDKLDEMAAEIKRLTLKIGEGVEIEGAQVTIREAYDRDSWNTRALDGYAISHPEIKELKKTTHVKASAVIKLE